MKSAHFDKDSLKRLVILGSTGSIGRQALEVVDAHRDRFSVVGLSAHSRVDLLIEQVKRFRPQVVGISDRAVAESSRKDLESLGVKLLSGEECLCELSSMEEVDLVLNAVVGSVGLPASLAALKGGKTLALANKESLVAGGELVMKALEKGGSLIPVDSEHSAIFQCLQGEKTAGLSRIILTASGGPFLGRRREELERVTVEQALAHPTWKMGRKITVDSATLMNKGLEVIEAHFLFGVDYQRIKVVAHPQSVIHSMVEFKDGSIKAQLSLPDMRLPIVYALSYPERWGPPFTTTAPEALGELTFGEVDLETFKCLGLAYRAGSMGGTATAALNAANEEAVEAFLQGRLDFLGIGDVVELVLDQHHPQAVENLNTIVEIEREVREKTRSLIKEREGG